MKILLVASFILAVGACRVEDAATVHQNNADSAIAKETGVLSREQNNNPNQVRNTNAADSEAGKTSEQKTSNKAASPAQSHGRETPKSSTVTAQELRQLLENDFGDFLLIDSSQPFYVQGDFNGDGNRDIAFVIGAQDRYAEEGTPGDIVDNLCRAGADTSIQNLRTSVFLPARPRQDCSVVESKKKALQTKYSPFGLLVVLGNQNGWREVFKQDAFGQKFLLLDAVYKPENQESSDKTDKLIVVQKSQSKQSQPIDADCLPTAAKGDGIFSGEVESGGKLIYYDGAKFRWRQCGD